MNHTPDPIEDAAYPKETNPDARDAEIERNWHMLCLKTSPIDSDAEDVARRAAFKAGVPLHQIEEELDWKENRLEQRVLPFSEDT